MGIKEKIHSKTNTISTKISYLKSDVKDVTAILETKDVIYLKTDAIAVLVKRKGELKKFLEAVDMITQEGCEIKAQDIWKLLEMPMKISSLAPIHIT